jgi:hypothetical protein
MKNKLVKSKKKPRNWIKPTKMTSYGYMGRPRSTAALCGEPDSSRNRRIIGTGDWEGWATRLERGCSATYLANGSSFGPPARELSPSWAQPGPWPGTLGPVPRPPGQALASPPSNEPFHAGLC